MENNAIATTNNTGMMAMTNDNSFCSFVPKTAAEKAKLFNAIQNPDEKLKDHVNEVINVKDVIVEMVTLEKKNQDGTPVVDDDGEIMTTEAPRIILIDDTGKSFTCTSVGVFSALKRIFNIFGFPNEWEKPLKMRPKLINKKDRSMLNLEIAK